MNRRIILSPDARADLTAAARWYHHKEIDLSRRFRAEVYSMLLRIAQHPYAFVRVYAAVRRARMDRFPYYIYFSFYADSVIVITIRHQRRADPGWQQRTDMFGGPQDD
jgi:plasmid stabilization system protein ParE